MPELAAVTSLLVRGAIAAFSQKLAAPFHDGGITDLADLD